MHKAKNVIEGKKVIWIAAWWPTKENKAFGTFIQEHAKALSDQGIEVYVLNVSIKKTTNQLFWKTVTEHETISGIHVFKAVIETRIRRFGINEYLIRSAFKKLFQEIAKIFEPKFIHLHVRDHVSKFAFDVPEIRRLPLIHTEHFSFYHRGIHQLDEKAKAKTKKELLHWFQHPNLKIFSPVSEELGQIIKEDYNLPADKLSIIGNVASDDFSFASNAEVQKRICLVASWHEPKNPMLFFKAFLETDTSVSSEFEIIVFGDGPLLKDCQLLIEKSAIAERVSFAGFQPKATIAKALQSSAFFVHPSDQENLPTSIIEALCSGLPVVSMSINGIPELVNPSNGILVLPKDITALKEALENMMQHFAGYDRKAISKQAASKFSRKSIAQKTIDLYESIT